MQLTNLHPADSATKNNSLSVQLNDITKNLSLGNQQIHILSGISLEIKKGEFLSITGPSGSGKSTLLGILAGLDSPTSGKVWLNGDLISEADEKKLALKRNREIGVVFQQFNLIPTLTALENVEAPLYINPSKGDATKIAKELLTKVGLADRMHHRPHQLSGGQQQRVAIARALACSPSIMVADEPTGNLDSKTSKEILELLTRIQKEEQKTLIIVTHEPDIAALADREVVLVDGQIQNIINH